MGLVNQTFHAPKKMSSLNFIGDDDFFLFINYPIKLFNILVTNNYLRSPPLRCSNCHKFNCFSLTKRKVNIKRPMSQMKAYELNYTDYYFSYYCKKLLVCNKINIYQFLRCKTKASPRSGTFFSTIDSSHRVSVKKVCKIIYNWSMDETVLSTSQNINLNTKSVSGWFKKIRDVCSSEFCRRKPFGGEGYVIEIDETLLHGKRKNNRGRPLKGDIWKGYNNKEFMEIC